MPRSLEPGPYRILTASDGSNFPWYAMPFDKLGACTAPLTRAHLLQEFADSDYTDVFFVSHGWNNDWSTATERYEDFLNGFIAMRQEHDLPVTRSYKPLMVGIIWPSTALVMPWEKAPRFAAGGAQTPEVEMDAEVAEERAIVAELAEAVDDARRDRFYELAQKSSGLDEAEALEFADMLRVIGTADQAELPGTETPSAEELVAAWSEAVGAFPTEAADDAPLEDDDFGTVDGDASDLQTAGLFSALDPRHLLRMTTVLQMKDRAGLVGSRGAAALLRDILAGSSARVHLVGHSYGAKLVLSALCAGTLSRPVASVLLLQPAVSRLCFAADAGQGQPGGYRSALQRSTLPLLSTFSRKDIALTRLFHLAARRKTDPGELRAAAWGDRSRFAALGGFGPGSLSAEECAVLKIKSIGDSYDLTNVDQRILGLEAHEAIGGHGKISNDYTWWALYDAVAAR